MNNPVVKVVKTYTPLANSFSESTPSENVCQGCIEKDLKIAKLIEDLENERGKY